MLFYKIMERVKNAYYPVLLIITFMMALLVLPVMLLLLFPDAEGNLLYLRMMASYPVTLAILPQTMRKMRGERISDLTGKIEPRLFIIITIFIFAISSLRSIIDGKVQPSGENAANILISLIISLLFIPAQCLIEELIFRIIPQKIALRNSFNSTTLEKVAVTAISSAVFSFLHLGNSEALLMGSHWASFIYFFLSGAFLFTLTFIEKGYTSAIAYHTANNLFIAVVINIKDAATIPSYPFFFSERNLAPAETITSLVLTMLMVSAIVMAYKKRQLRRA